ncbi:glycosyltransferase family 2 protein [Anditalea andensis]|uniref:Glycosyltransferase 2-like domain-containing protein n=1 Tax=Anditalea andensis TaxID=1048983 RepID=A0A074KRP9_9BACT|nr:glycosyltransferase [Anditalea andensis]KEO72596.1 hypothetical protein EL17_17820 [Anditalea andensis]
MGNQPKLVTVLMPVYNGEKYLKEAIDSILNQTFSDFDFLIINDASNDQTEDIILSYHDERIKYLKNEENIKVTATLNRGLSLIETKYIARMDADDISLPHRLATQVHLMEERNDISLCGSGRYTFFSSNEKAEEEVVTIYEENKLLIHSLFNTSISHPSVMMRTSILHKYQIRYNTNYIYAQDKAMWLDLARYGKIFNIKEPLIKYRLHADQVSTKHQSISRNNSVKISQLAFSDMGVEISDEELMALMLLCYPQSCGSLKNLFIAGRLVERILKRLKNNPLIDYSYLRSFLVNRLTRIIVYSSELGIPILFFIMSNRRLTLLKFGKKFYIKTFTKKAK